MKTKISYGTCSVAVIGMDMNCPLCGTLVRSGESHRCEKTDEPKKLAAPKKRKAVKP